MNDFQSYSSQLTPETTVDNEVFDVKVENLEVVEENPRSVYAPPPTKNDSKQMNVTKQTNSVPPVVPYAGVTSTQYEMSESDRTLRLIAFIFNILFTICFGFLIIPLLWMIPMTVRSYNIYKGKRPNTVAFGICTLLFLNIISGILLLSSTKNNA